MLIFGSAGPAAISHQHPLILKNVLGAQYPRDRRL